MRDIVRFNIGRRDYTYDRNSRVCRNDVILLFTKSFIHPETRRCNLCKFASRPKLKSKLCSSCLLTDDLDEFVMDEWMPARLKDWIQKLTQEENDHDEKRNP